MLKRTTKHEPTAPKTPTETGTALTPQIDAEPSTPRKIFRRAY